MAEIGILLLTFVVSMAVIQVFYFFLNLFGFLEKISWLSLTLVAIGLGFGWSFGILQATYFKIGYAIFIIGFLLVVYTVFEKDFLPDKINKILYHPKMLNPYR